MGVADQERFSDERTGPVIDGCKRGVFLKGDGGAKGCCNTPGYDLQIAILPGYLWHQARMLL